MKIKHAFFISSIYAASTVHADGFYALGAVGQSRYNSSHDAADHALAADADLTADGTAGVPSRFDNLDTGYKAQIGYSFNQNFSVEGGYVDLGKQHYDVDFSSGTGRGSFGASGWNIDAVGTVPVAGALSVFGKAGVIDAKTKYHLDGTDAGGDIVDNRENYKWSPNFGIGASYAVANNTDVRFEVERFADIGKKNTTGEQNVDLVSLGAAYHFN